MNKSLVLSTLILSAAAFAAPASAQGWNGGYYQPHELSGSCIEDDGYNSSAVRWSRCYFPDGTPRPGVDVVERSRNHIVSVIYLGDRPRDRGYGGPSRHFDQGYRGGGHMSGRCKFRGEVRPDEECLSNGVGPRGGNVVSRGGPRPRVMRDGRYYEEDDFSWNDVAENVTSGVILGAIICGVSSKC